MKNAANAQQGAQDDAILMELTEQSPKQKKQKGASGKGKHKESADVQPPGSQRTLWIWVHPSVFDEVFAELRLCISLTLETLKKASPSAENIVNVEIADLRQHLNVFEIMGPKASQVIRGALKPVFEDGRDDFKKVISSRYLPCGNV